MSNDRYALISVYDKTNLELAAKLLIENNFNIIATQGTGKYLKKFRFSHLPAESMTGNPHALKDCIQTISYNFQAGILHNHQNPDHKKQIEALSIKQIHVVICNFPPVVETIKSLDKFNIQHIDVGGPLMVRAAATNFKDVIVLVDKNDYKKLSKLLFCSEKTDKNLRQELAIKAFQYCIDYDNSIIEFLRLWLNKK